MKRIILSIAASIDGMIAEPDGGLEWLIGFTNPNKTARGANPIREVDTIIMGGRTYRELLTMDVIWPYKEQYTYVISHHDWGTKENVSFVTEDVIDTIANLKTGEGKDILLAGGGMLTSMLLKVGLIDELQITYIPVILGDGIPLFPRDPDAQVSTWKLNFSKVFDDGVQQVSYSKM